MVSLKYLILFQYILIPLAVFPNNRDILLMFHSSIAQISLSEGTLYKLLRWDTGTYIYQDEAHTTVSSIVKPDYNITSCWSEYCALCDKMRDTHMHARSCTHARMHKILVDSDAIILFGDLGSVPILLPVP